jgi:hypothetical protein
MSRGFCDGDLRWEASTAEARRIGNARKSPAVMSDRRGSAARGRGRRGANTSSGGLRWRAAAGMMVPPTAIRTLVGNRLGGTAAHDEEDGLCPASEPPLGPAGRLRPLTGGIGAKPDGPEVDPPGRLFYLPPRPPCPRPDARRKPFGAPFAWSASSPPSRPPASSLDRPSNGGEAVGDLRRRTAGPWVPPQSVSGPTPWRVGGRTRTSNRSTSCARSHGTYVCVRETKRGRALARPGCGAPR